jgi:hypothetical protein
LFFGATNALAFSIPGEGGENARQVTKQEKRAGDGVTFRAQMDVICPLRGRRRRTPAFAPKPRGDIHPGSEITNGST